MVELQIVPPLLQKQHMESMTPPWRDPLLSSLLINQLKDICYVTKKSKKIRAETNILARHAVHLHSRVGW